MYILLASLLGYILGSIPFALVIGKVFYKTDIREHGSGNLGGTNAGRTLGSKAAAGVIVFDVLKATFAMALTALFAKDYIIYAGFFATLGHCFPLFANFKGGKAVSTAMGFLLGITIFITHAYFSGFILPILIFLAFLYLTKMVSLSSIIAVSCASVILMFTATPLVAGTFTIIAIIVIWRHRTNITRIMNGEERKITWM